MLPTAAELVERMKDPHRRGRVLAHDIRGALLEVIEVESVIADVIRDEFSARMAPQKEDDDPGREEQQHQQNGYYPWLRATHFTP